MKIFVVQNVAWELLGNILAVLTANVNLTGARLQVLLITHFGNWLIIFVIMCNVAH